MQFVSCPVCAGTTVCHEELQYRTYHLPAPIFHWEEPCSACQTTPGLVGVEWADAYTNDAGNCDGCGRYTALAVRAGIDGHRLRLCPDCPPASEEGA